MSLNKVIIQGNITHDLELKATANGTSVCSFNVAVNAYSKDPREAKTNYLTVVAWSQKAEFVSQYFKKGSPILIVGRLDNREWTDKNGNKRISTEIIAEEINFCGGKEKTDDGSFTSPTAATATAPAFSPSIPTAYGGADKFEDIPNDETLPF